MVSLPVAYKGKKSSFALNLPWCQAMFPGPGKPVPLPYEQAMRLVKDYPTSFYIYDEPKPAPEEEPQKAEGEGQIVGAVPPVVVELPQSDVDLPPVTHYVLDFGNMNVLQLRKAVRILFGEQLPDGATKAQIFHFVNEKMENMADEDRPTVVGHERYVPAEEGSAQ